jgi:hypothetical protein
LGEETAVFAADDALGFSYEALPRLNKKSMLGSIGKLFAAKKDSEGAAEATPAEETSNGDGEVFTFTLRDVMATAEDWDDQGAAADEPADVAVDTEQVSLDAEIAALELSVAQVDELFEPEALDMSPAALDLEPLTLAPSEPEPVPEQVAETDAVAEPEQVGAPKPSAPQEPEPTERLHLALARLLEAVEQKKFPPQHLDRINDLIQSVTALMEATHR